MSPGLGVFGRFKVECVDGTSSSFASMVESGWRVSGTETDLSKRSISITSPMMPIASSSSLIATLGKS